MLNIIQLQGCENYANFTSEKMWFRLFDQKTMNENKFYGFGVVLKGQFYPGGSNDQ